MSKYLITGGAGYIGSHVAKLVLDHGHEVVIADNLSTGNALAVRLLQDHYQHQVTFIKTDLREKDMTDALMQDEYAAVFHLAGSALVQESMQHPWHYFRNNVLGMLNLLESNHDNFETIVYASTCNIYGGIHSRWGLFEDFPPAPSSPYGASKWMLEQLAYWSGMTQMLKTVGLRFFNVAGASHDGTLGEWHVPETHIIPLMIQAAKGEHDLVLYESQGRSPIREFVHVEDVAEAFWRCRHLNGNEVYNVTNGKPASIRDVLHEVTNAMGRSIPFKTMPLRPGDPEALRSQGHQLEQVVGFRPSCSLEQMVRSAVAWHETHPAGYAT